MVIKQRQRRKQLSPSYKRVDQVPTPPRLAISARTVYCLRAPSWAQQLIESTARGPLTGAQVVILLLLSHVGWNGPSSPRVQPCSRAQSRVARQLVRRKVTAVLQRYRVSLGPECPLHPSRDLFWWPAGLMADEAPAADPQPQPSWNCPMCGRSFFCHEKLTSHWDEEHAPNLTPKVTPPLS